MTLRRPAAHLRQAPLWRRSGDESHWERTVSEGTVSPCASRPERKPRPQSAIEGRQLDGWLEHLQRMQGDLLRTPFHDQGPAFSDGTASVTSLDNEPNQWRPTGTPTFTRASSSCGSSTMYESSLGSQDSLQMGYFPPPERRGSLERVHIKQAPRKERAQFSNLLPVKTGWLPIERKVMVADPCQQNQFSDRSAGQVKLKQSITPTIPKSRVTANRHQDGEVERSHTSPGALGVKMWQAPDQDSPVIKKGPEKESVPAHEADRSVGWQSLRRGWSSGRVSAFPQGSQSTGTGSDPDRKSPLKKTTSTDPLRRTTPAHLSTSTDPCKPQYTPLLGTGNSETHKSHTPLHKIGSVQPMKATAQLCTTNSIPPRPSRTHTSSAVTTIPPQNLTSFSSITLSSRKVSRSASLPESETRNRYSESPPPPTAHQRYVDPSARQVTVQRKATIVKVTEQRTTSSSVPGRRGAGTPPATQDPDTVVHRRKATIIKVTEHSESYSPARVRQPENRHSYTEGLYEENDAWTSRGNHTQSPYRHLDSKKRPSPAVTPNNSIADLDKNGRAVHRSTLSLVVSNPPAIEAPAASEVSLRAAGRRPDVHRRPLSCYGNVFGHTEPSEAHVAQPAAGKWSYGLRQGTNVNPVNPSSGISSSSSNSSSSGSSFVRPRSAVIETGQLVAGDARGPSGGQRDGSPAENAARRASPSLTLIQAPDPHSHQSQEQVLALNAAAVIANIKLQRQLSKKKTTAPNGDSGKESTASPRGNAVTDEGKCTKPHPAQNKIQSHSQPHAPSVPMSLQPQRSPTKAISLQEALQRSRPDFISRSQGRVRELEQRAQERRELSDPADPRLDAACGQRRVNNSARSTSANDNLFRPRDRVITGREAQHRSKRTVAEVKRKKEDEKKRELCVSNRQRVELFKKKLLDQILQRSGGRVTDGRPR